MDKGTKLIIYYMVPDAFVHDSLELKTHLDTADTGQLLYTNATYIVQDEAIEQCCMTNKFHEKGNKHQILTESQRASNRQKGRHRVRVELGSSFLNNSMKAMYIRTIGYVRATEKIGLANLTYNLIRCTQRNK